MEVEPFNVVGEVLVRVLVEVVVSVFVVLVVVVYLGSTKDCNSEMISIGTVARSQVRESATLTTPRL